MDPRTPCIVGVAQESYRDKERDAPEPLEIWAAMAKQAARDSGGNNVLEAVDSLHVVYPMAWQYDDPPARLAQRLGLKDGKRAYSGVSGTTTQQMVNDSARDIVAGRSEVALITSAEVLATKRRLRLRGHEPDWSFRPDEKPPFPTAEAFQGTEIAHQFFQAYISFAIFDIARRAHLGLAPDENRQKDGELLARLTGVAANHPKAWFPIASTARDLIEVTKQNRMISYPYTKNMVAIMDVDMGAALIVMSHGKADALGIARDRRITLRGFCSAQDPARMASRGELWRSRAMAEASQEALRCAGVGLDDVAHLDLYSCFASAVNFARDALKISENETRPLTLTGGLPYFGGPGSGYVTHSIATLVEKLREEPAEFGLISGVGMHMQKHVYGIYSGTAADLELPDEAAVQSRASDTPLHAIEDTANGPATIASYCVEHNREGALRGVAICDLPSGGRCYAVALGEDTMASMQREEWVGRSVELVADANGVNQIQGA